MYLKVSGKQKMIFSKMKQRSLCQMHFDRLIQLYDMSRIYPQKSDPSRYSPKTPRNTSHISPKVALALAASMKCGIR